MPQLPFATRTFLPVALIFLLASAALAKPFTSPKGYQITPAAGWGVNSSGVMGMDVVIYAPTSQSFNPNLNVVSDPVPAGLTLEQMRPMVNTQMQHALTYYKLLSQGYVTIDGIQMLNTYGEHSFGNPLRRLYIHQLAGINHGTIYVFTCTSLLANHAKYDAAFSAMLQSIRWSVPAPAATPAPATTPAPPAPAAPAPSTPSAPSAPSAPTAPPAPAAPPAAPSSSTAPSPPATATGP